MSLNAQFTWFPSPTKDPKHMCQKFTHRHGTDQKRISVPQMQLEDAPAFPE